MASVNKVILVGNVGRDPEVRYTQGGDPIANFSIATNEVWTDKSGQKQEHTEWHNVEVFGKTAQVVQNYVTKGRQIYIEGTLRTNEYKDKDGNQKKTVRVRVSGPNSRLVLLGGRGGEGGGGGGSYGRGGSGGSSSGGEAPPDDFQASDDDVPF
jgi:single-strand DNA-binding protein